MAISIDEYQQQQPAFSLDIIGELRKIIDQSLPEAEAKVWHRAPVWFLDGNPVAGYAVRKNYVALLFWSGQSFEESGLKATGSFKMAERHYTDASEIDPTEITRWLGKAREVQWDYKNIVKKKGNLERLV